jgi:hypothetical protein
MKAITVSLLSVFKKAFIALAAVATPFLMVVALQWVGECQSALMAGPLGGSFAFAWMMLTLFLVAPLSCIVAIVTVISGEGDEFVPMGP